MAQNSDEVKDAISASVLPVGSSRMKRHADWSITLNAHVEDLPEELILKITTVQLTKINLLQPLG